MSPAASIPAPLLERCDGVVEIPHRDLTEKEVGQLWGADRAALGTCQSRHQALSDAVRVNEGK